MTSLAPWRAAAMEIARTIPLAAPVTITTLPFRIPLIHRPRSVINANMKRL
jgi:hypothetical protein